MKLVVRNNRIGPVLGGHPWVFSGAFVQIPEGLESGTEVQLYSEDGRYLASGYFNSYSQIAVRVWGYDKDEAVDRDFFTRRVSQAFECRSRLIGSKDTNCYRLINGENDFLPGLVVDRYDEILSLQFHTKGMKKYQDLIVAALTEVIKPAGIYERSEIKFTGDEHPQSSEGLLSGEVPDLTKVKENGLRFLVDVKHGQKTGFFLDQRQKRQFLRKYCDGASVLNCFCYTGGFSVYALAGGAKKVINVDLSQSALDLAKENIKLNKFPAGKCEFHRADVKQFLKGESLPEQDIVILDPPAFIKNRKKKEEGLVGYKAINLAALNKIKDKGLLVSCSCSQALSLTDMRFMLVEAGAKSGKTLQILETLTHDLDHPTLAPYIESDYLKAFFLRVIGK